MQITVTRDYALMHWVDGVTGWMRLTRMSRCWTFTQRTNHSPLRPTARTVAAQHRVSVMFAMAIFRHRARGFLLSPRRPAGPSFLCPHRSTALF